MSYNLGRMVLLSLVAAACSHKHGKSEPTSNGGDSDSTIAVNLSLTANQSLALSSQPAVVAYTIQVNCANAASLSMGPVSYTWDSRLPANQPMRLDRRLTGCTSLMQQVLIQDPVDTSANGLYTLNNSGTMATDDAYLAANALEPFSSSNQVSSMTLKPVTLIGSQLPSHNGNAIEMSYDYNLAVHKQDGSNSVTIDISKPLNVSLTGVPLPDLLVDNLQLDSATTGTAINPSLQVQLATQEAPTVNLTSIPAGSCTGSDGNTYKAVSAWRLINHADASLPPQTILAGTNNGSAASWVDLTGAPFTLASSAAAVQAAADQCAGGTVSVAVFTGCEDVNDNTRLSYEMQVLQLQLNVASVNVNAAGTSGACDVTLPGTPVASGATSALVPYVFSSHAVGGLDIYTGRILPTVGYSFGEEMTAPATGSVLISFGSGMSIQGNPTFTVQGYLYSAPSITDYNVPVTLTQIAVSSNTFTQADFGPVGSPTLQTFNFNNVPLTPGAVYYVATQFISLSGFDANNYVVTTYATGLPTNRSSLARSYDGTAFNDGEDVTSYYTTTLGYFN